MTIYVDSLHAWGFKLRGHEQLSCHMFTDEIDLTALHAMAESIGMRRAWFQDKSTAPHYDLVPSRRAHAVRLGAVEVGRHESVRIWRARRASIQGAGGR